MNGVISLFKRAEVQVPAIEKAKQMDLITYQQTNVFHPKIINNSRFKRSNF